MAAGREAKQPHIAPGSRYFPREDYGILTDGAKIRRQPVDDVEELATISARISLIAYPHGGRPSADSV
jgi:hypothetical protein